MLKSNSSLSLKRNDAVLRALSMVGKGVYELGAGGRKPSNKDPLGDSRKGKPGRMYCDCSGFVCWSLGIDRLQTWANSNPDDDTWYSCEWMIEDALSEKYVLFEKIPLDKQVMPGDIIVYGPKGKMKWGHVGLITSVLPGFKRGETDWWKFLSITHCSTGGTAAVRTSNAKIWYDALIKKDSGAYIIRYRGFADELESI